MKHYVHLYRIDGAYIVLVRLFFSFCLTDCRNNNVLRSAVNAFFRRDSCIHKDVLLLVHMIVPSFKLL